jgi:hypothetical protein
VSEVLEEVLAQPRPMLGRLPWLAFERRMRAFFFLVFFDMGDEPSGVPMVLLGVGVRVESSHRGGTDPRCVHGRHGGRALVRSVGEAQSRRIEPTTRSPVGCLSATASASSPWRPLVCRGRCVWTQVELLSVGILSRCVPPCQ